MTPPKTLTVWLSLALAATFWQFPRSIQAEEVEGVNVPDTLIAGDDILVLNGTAVRSVWGFGVYVVGLYLKESSKDERSIMTEDSFPKRIHMTLLREIKIGKFESTVQDNIDCNFSNAEKTQFATELTAFLDCFREDKVLEKGAIVNIDYLPGSGTQVSIEPPPTQGR